MRVLATIVLVGMLSSGTAGVYVVRPGDTLSGIAARVGSTASAIAAASGLKDPDRIRIGQRLTIPDKAPPAPPPPAARPGTHLVARGESVASIAAKYHIDPAVLVVANGIVDGRIYTGTRLRLAPLTGPDGRPLTGPPLRGGTGVHVVRRGQTLAGIAAANGTTAAAIAAANGLRDPNRIREGQRLAIPGAGTWRCPVTGRPRFINDWGFGREGGRAHEGTDLMADRGTPVVAPVAGVVRHVTGARGGNQFTLRGDDGFVYIGSHLHTFGAAGRVPAGAVLGTVGTSGDAAGTPPHLHFEIHPGGIGPVNPYPTLRQACA